MESYVLATLALHNYLRLTDNATYTPKGFVDSEDSTGNVTEGKWRKNADANGLVNLPNVRGSSYSEDALSMREALKTYVNSLLGKVDWPIRSRYQNIDMYTDWMFFQCFIVFCFFFLFLLLLNLKSYMVYCYTLQKR